VEPRGPAAYLAELLGTFLLVLAITMVLTVERGGLNYLDFAVIGLVHAFVLMLLIHSLGGTSGAHFNPAVTTALAVLRKIALIDAAIYILLQLAGAVAGALVTRILLSDEGKGPIHYGAAQVSQDLLQGKPLPGLLAEALGAFLLMWAIMAMAVNPRGARDWAGFVIGSSLGLGVMMFGPLTGAGFNPARWFGPAIVSGQYPDAWIYIVGPVLGTLAAAFAYTFLVLGPQRREGEAPIEHLA
jgi:MIP family channel proteins